MILINIKEIRDTIQYLKYQRCRRLRWISQFLKIIKKIKEELKYHYPKDFQNRINRVRKVLA